MELVFLGTGAGMPSRERNVTSIVLKMFEERGTFWMFDCGEGTQQQVMRSPLKLSKLEKIFITHLHGDHVYGLPGLLTSRANQGGEQPLTVYGPPGLRNFLDIVLEISQARIEYELHVEEIQEGIVFQDEHIQVETALLEHRIDSFGYRLTECDQPGKLQHQKLLSRGIPPGPLYAQIKRGTNILLADGSQLKAADFVGAALPGRIVTILGDTRVCANSKRLALGADVLVHEATFAADLHDLAYKYHHSTFVQAAETARACQVKQLILTHFSSRYRQEEIEALVEEVREIMPRVLAAEDFSGYVVPRPLRT